MPSDLSGWLMFTVTPEKALPDTSRALLRLLIKEGLKTVCFEHVAYFALVFAAHMIVFEYQSRYQDLEKLLMVFLFKFLPLYVIQSLELAFDRVFETVPGQPACSLGLKAMDNAPTFRLNSNIDLSVWLRRIDLIVTEFVNQVTFCRSELAQTLVNVLVIKPAQEKSPLQREELRQRFFKIEVIKNLDFLDSLVKVGLNRGQKSRLRLYNDLSILSRYFYGATNRECNCKTSTPSEKCRRSSKRRQRRS